MSSLEIIITIETEEGESWKEVTCKINDKKIPESYSYEETTDDNTIRAEVEADLTEKGYTW